MGTYGERLLRTGRNSLAWITVYWSPPQFLAPRERRIVEQATARSKTAVVALQRRGAPWTTPGWTAWFRRFLEGAGFWDGSGSHSILIAGCSWTPLALPGAATTFGRPKKPMPVIRACPLTFCS